MNAMSLTPKDAVHDVVQTKHVAPDVVRRGLPELPHLHHRLRQLGEFTQAVDDEGVVDIFGS